MTTFQVRLFGDWVDQGIAKKINPGYKKGVENSGSCY